MSTTTLPAPAVVGAPPVERPRRPAVQLVVLLAGLFVAVSGVGVAIATGALPEASLGLAVPALQLVPLIVSLVVWSAFGRTPSLSRLWALRGAGPGGARRVLGGLGTIVLVVLGVGLAQTALAWTAQVPIDLQPSLWSTLPMVPVVALVLCLTCFGEEVVWRGHLFVLFDGLSAWRRVVVTSLIWAMWHVPLLLGHLAAGQLRPREAVAAALNIAVAGLVLGWVRTNTGRVWPAVLGHALLNSALVAIASGTVPGLRGFSDAQFWTYQVIGFALWLGAARLLAMRHRELRGSD